MIQRLLLSTLLLFAVNVNASASNLASRWVELYGDRITFDVYRKDRKIGTYQTLFEPQGELLSVSIDMQLEIPILFGWTYDYAYRARELWLNDELLSLDVSVDDNGDITTLSAANRQGMLSGAIGDKEVAVALPLLPTHHYNADVLDDARVFNTLTGRENAVTISAEGKDRVKAENRLRESSRYRYNGDLEDTIDWYDLRGRWVKMTFPGTDGTPIELRCTRCSSPQ